MHHQNLWRDLLIWLFGVVIGASLVVGGIWFEGEMEKPKQTSNETVKVVSFQPHEFFIKKPAVKQSSTPDLWVPIVEKVGPIVVNIDNDEETLWGETNAGSGIIFDSRQGLIVTNYHVIEGSKKITVTLKDGRRFIAKRLGFEPHLDIALLRVQTIKGLPKVKFGSSETLKEGAWVIAIGNPFGFSNTVTVGIVSAKGRNLPEDDTLLDDLIQTDASINPGNSGGALVNSKGEIVGINVAMKPEAQGIAFAIPIETVKDVVEQLLKHRQIRQPILGLRYEMLAEEERKRLGILTERALMVREVIANMPAAKVGLQQGDAIVAINEIPVKDNNHLRSVVKQSARHAQPIKLQVFRKGRLLNITVRPEWVAIHQLLK